MTCDQVLQLLTLDAFPLSYSSTFCTIVEIPLWLYWSGQWKTQNREQCLLPTSSTVCQYLLQWNMAQSMTLEPKRRLKLMQFMCENKHDKQKKNCYRDLGWLWPSWPPPGYAPDTRLSTAVTRCTCSQRTYALQPRQLPHDPPTVRCSVVLAYSPAWLTRCSRSANFEFHCMNTMWLASTSINITMAICIINLGALVVTNAMLRRLTTWRFIRPIIIIQMSMVYLNGPTV